MKLWSLLMQEAELDAVLKQAVAVWAGEKIEGLAGRVRRALTGLDWSAVEPEPDWIPTSERVDELKDFIAKQSGERAT